MEKVLITDYGFKNIDQEKKIITEAGFELIAAQCKTPEDVLTYGAEAAALLVQWAPVTASVIDGLKKCRLIVRYGIGVDNLDLEAAQKKGIVVCNVPDYCIAEVADHTVSLALALARQLTETHKRTVSGEWKIIPPDVALPFYEMKFATIGFGRIAREVLKRATSFRFKKMAYDPFVGKDDMESLSVEKSNFDEIIETADIISLHLPLTQQTHHIINEDVLNRMKKGAILVNTSRGGLIDTEALASRLASGALFAGLDVYEKEPLPVEHPLIRSKNVILTSHTAWYSERSVPTLQRMAAEELVRGISGSTVKNRVV
ncbi:MAG: C-terminal binding protein [Chitinophagaceae bacterium]|nr:C-terminal binding protein [Chitinophagaceae bacterium]MCW5928503.1 C-terminal binding protein [Chitinophagaceae bacterium]